MVARALIAGFPGSKSDTLRTTKASRMSSAGPAAKAEARNRGARIAVSQNGLAARPAYRNAVTVWMLTAHGMDRMMIGLIQPGGGSPRRSALSGTRPMRQVRARAEPG